MFSKVIQSIRWGVASIFLVPAGLLLVCAFILTFDDIEQTMRQWFVRHFN